MKLLSLKYIALAFIVCTNCTLYTNEITYTVYRDEAIAPYSNTIFTLAKSLYYDYPYLYSEPASGDEFSCYNFGIEGAIMVVARDSDALVGIFIGTPTEANPVYPDLVAEHEAYVPGKSIVLRDGMVKRDYQRKGIGLVLMDIFEQESKKAGYTDIYFLTVVRSDNHPFKPASYTSLEAPLMRLGYKKTSITAPWAWSTRCGSPDNEFIATIDNMVRIWHKKIIAA